MIVNGLTVSVASARLCQDRLPGGGQRRFCGGLASAAHQGPEAQMWTRSLASCGEFALQVQGFEQGSPRGCRTKRSVEAASMPVSAVARSLLYMGEEPQIIEGAEELDTGVALAGQSKRWARVSEAGVAGLASALQIAVGSADSVVETWSDDRFWLTSASAAERCQYLAVGNAINFRFWRPTEAGIEVSGGLLDGEFLLGSLYMWRRLRLIVERDEFPILSAERLALLDMRTFEQLFADDHARNPLGEAIEDRVHNLRDLGTQLRARWHGRFADVVSASDGSLSTFFALSARFRAYDDPLRKLSSVNAIMLSGAGLAEFSDDIPAAMDYHLAKQLLRFGAVDVDQATTTDLEQQKLLPNDIGTAIRAACLDALGEACERAHVSGALVDNLLWRNRSVCTEPVPECLRCPINRLCARRVTLQRPLELTRYY